MGGGRRELIIALAIGGLLTFLGCGPRNRPATGVDRDTRVRLNLLAKHYREYLNNNRGAPPKDADAFREFLESRSDDLSAYKKRGLVGSLDELLTSARDDQPFVVVCGELKPGKQSPDALWVAYEQQGVDGNRLAVSTYGGEQLLSAEEFESEISQGN